MFYTAKLSIIWQSPLTDHSLSLDHIYTNTPSPKVNPMHDYIQTQIKIKHNFIGINVY